MNTMARKRLGVRSLSGSVVTDCVHTDGSCQLQVRPGSGPRNESKEGLWWPRNAQNDDGQPKSKQQSKTLTSLIATLLWVVKLPKDD